MQWVIIMRFSAQSDFSLGSCIPNHHSNHYQMSIPHYYSNNHELFGKEHFTRKVWATQSWENLTFVFLFFTSSRFPLEWIGIGCHGRSAITLTSIYPLSMNSQNVLYLGREKPRQHCLSTHNCSIIFTSMNDNLIIIDHRRSTSFIYLIRLVFP